MISTFSTIEVKESNQTEYLLFKNIGQILKAHVQKKISKDIYLIKFSKGSILVQSKTDLTEGNQIYLRVESLRPKIILKQITEKELGSIHAKPDLIHIIEKPSLWKLIKSIYQKDPEIKSMLQPVFNPKKIREKDFWEGVKKLFLHLSHDTSSEYSSFIKAINNRISGLYLQLPCFYSIRDIEIYFELKKGSDPRDKKCIICINLELSALGIVNIIIEEENGIGVSFRVKEESTQALINKHLDSLKERLKQGQTARHIHLDCKIMPKEYWEKEFCFNIMKQQDNRFLDIVA